MAATTQSFAPTLNVQATGAIKKARAVTVAGTQAAGIGQKVLGVATVDAVAGDTLAVTVLHTAIAEAGAPIAAGDDLVSDAQGRVIPASPLAIAAGATAVTSAAANGVTTLSGGVTPHHVFATALTAATAAGALVSILMRR